MVQITEVSIISIDKGDEPWAIEGEIVFEGELTTPFSVSYSPNYDELEDLEIEIIPGNYDVGVLKEMILDAAYQYDE